MNEIPRLDIISGKFEYGCNRVEFTFVCPICGKLNVRIYDSASIKRVVENMNGINLNVNMVYTGGCADCSLRYEIYKALKPRIKIKIDKNYWKGYL